MILIVLGALVIKLCTIIIYICTIIIYIVNKDNILQYNKKTDQSLEEFGHFCVQLQTTGFITDFLVATPDLNRGDSTH